MEKQRFVTQAPIDDLEIDINIKNILYCIVKKWWLVLIFMAVSTAIAYAFTIYTYFPVYNATTSMIVNSNQIKVIGQDVVNINDISLSRQLVDTYTVILKSNRVMEHVVEKLGLSITPTQLRSCVSVYPDKNAGILYLTVTDPDPQRALHISKTIMEVAPDIISQTVEVGSVKVLDEAVLPRYPIPPSTVRNSLLGMLIGIVLGVLIIVISKYFKPTVISAVDVRSKLELPVLGSIPHMKKAKWRGRHAVPLIINSNVNINFFESVKSLRTNVLYLSEREDIHTILIAGATENEGKTTTSINLALSLCSRFKVLLIDADMRKPDVAGALHILGDVSVPLKLLLEHPDKYEKFVYVEPTSGLGVISLKESKLTSDLLSLPQFKGLIDQLKRDFDFVIIDSPPAQMHADATIISQCVDAVILTIKQDHAPLDVIAQTQNDFVMIQAKMIGCILNDARYMRSDAVDRYRYYHRS